MEKRRISRILARADGAAVKRLADEIKDRPVIGRSFLTNNDLFCQRLFHSSSMAQSARFTNHR